jgi:hypothetical protein
MTMRRGHHTSSVLKALGAHADDKNPPEEEIAEPAEENADIEPA